MFTWLIDFKASILYSQMYGIKSLFVLGTVVITQGLLNYINIYDYKLQLKVKPPFIYNTKIMEIYQFGSQKFLAFNNSYVELIYDFVQMNAVFGQIVNYSCSPLNNSTSCLYYAIAPSNFAY